MCCGESACSNSFWKPGPRPVCLGCKHFVHWISQVHKSSSSSRPWKVPFQCWKVSFQVHHQRNKTTAVHETTCWVTGTPPNWISFSSIFFFFFGGGGSGEFGFCTTGRKASGRSLVSLDIHVGPNRLVATESLKSVVSFCGVRIEWVRAQRSYRRTHTFPQLLFSKHADVFHFGEKDDCLSTVKPPEIDLFHQNIGLSKNLDLALEFWKHFDVCCSLRCLDPFWQWVVKTEHVLYLVAFNRSTANTGVETKSSSEFLLTFNRSGCNFSLFALCTFEWPSERAVLGGFQQWPKHGCVPENSETPISTTSNLHWWNISLSQKTTEVTTNKKILKSFTRPCRPRWLGSAERTSRRDELFLLDETQQLRTNGGIPPSHDADKKT